ncbi:glutathione S-transferase D5-like [Anopheles bellator]|uniref:glutathione S-transferase D5-like n=1 Tax=Anopheles bellator TaxID=139047 RepID=UPI00264A1307|nr:glutathione S-transferase D5-like [Anopheles bellator]
MELYSDIVSPPCQNVLLVAKKLGISLKLKKVDFNDPADVAALTKLNPQHTIPTLVDDGHVIWESFAIMMYLVEKYATDDTLYPKDTKVRSVVNQRMFFDIGTLYKNVLANLEAALGGKEPTDEMREKLRKALDLVERFVTERPYAAADHLTIADACMLSSINALGWFKYGLEAYPGIRAWVARVSGEFPDYDAFYKEMREKTDQYIENANSSN